MRPKGAAIVSSLRLPASLIARAFPRRRRRAPRARARRSASLRADECEDRRSGPYAALSRLSASMRSPSRGRRSGAPWSRRNKARSAREWVVPDQSAAWPPARGGGDNPLAGTGRLGDVPRSRGARQKRSSDGDPADLSQPRRQARRGRRRRRAAGLRGPAIIIVGSAVTSRDKLDWHAPAGEASAAAAAAAFMLANSAGELDADDEDG